MLAPHPWYAGTLSAVMAYMIEDLYRPNAVMDYPKVRNGVTACSPHSLSLLYSPLTVGWLVIGLGWIRSDCRRVGPSGYEKRWQGLQKIVIRNLDFL